MDSLCPADILFTLVNIKASQVALVVKNPPAKAGDSGDMGSIPGSGRFSGGGPNHYSRVLASLLSKGHLNINPANIKTAGLELMLLNCGVEKTLE